MKCHQFLVLLALPLHLSAQVVLGEEDMPVAGGVYPYAITTLPEFQAGNTGADHTWDLSHLAPITLSADTMVTVASTPLLYQLYFNNPWLYPATRADHALRGAAMEVPMVTLDNPCTYFATADQQYRQVGYGVTLNGIPLPVQRLPVDVVHRLPLQYGDSDSSQSVINLTVPTMGHYGQSQMRYNQVDGYGTLHLPSGSFEVLRVASRLVRSDTVYVDQFGFGMRLPVPETVEYKWLAPGHGRPVLEVITTAGLVTSVRYFVEPATSVTTVPGDGGLQGPYPNPANERFTARFGPSGRVEVLAMDGRVLQRLQGKPGTQRQVDVSAWPVGMYMVTTEGAAWRLMIAR